VQEAIDVNEARCVELAELLKNRESIYLLGRRESLAIAREAALKIK
jgi:fructoselysine-6-P-deglycase FrlB-like protein